MNEQKSKADGVIVIDVRRLVDAVVRRIWLVIAATATGAVLALAVTAFFITPQYQSAAMFYVNNTDISVGNAKLSLSSSDISASRGLVDTYIVILNTRETLADILDYAGVSMKPAELAKIIQSEAVNDTEVFKVTVTHPDPEKAELLADAIAHILPKRISGIIDGASAKVVDSAVFPSEPSSPNYLKNTLFGFALGLLLSAGTLVLRELLDVNIRTEEDVAQITACPVLAAIPDMQNPGKAGYYYGYGSTKKQPSPAQSKQPVLVGSGISFSASEAYKMLRTKLQYSFADENACRVIGVSSAMTGEGKSLTAVNLAHTLSQLDKRVLLMDCDMRRPSLPAKLPIAKRPGLSGFLSGQNQQDHLIQRCGMFGEEDAFHVIASGQNPPNPVELLSSARMARLLKRLRTGYDYIILDLPPIGQVSDALAVAKETDGMLLVVRRNHCSRTALSAAVRQFEFIDCRLLGIVYNCAAEEVEAGYYKSRKNSAKYEGSFLSEEKTGKTTLKGEKQT